MSLSRPKTGGGSVESDNSDIRDLTPNLTKDASRSVNLRDLGFVGYVSTRALAEIERNETRASRVVTTAARFAFR